MSKIRENFLPFALPDIGKEELNEIREAIESDWITTGPKVRKFEVEFAKAVNAKHAIAANSCTAAMHLALEAIGLQRGEEVITTPYTFAATAEVIRYFDARPVFVDIQAEDLNIDPSQIESVITERTRAIVPVHIAGFPADLNAIYDIAERYHLAVVEDAAHAFPAVYCGKKIGASPERKKYRFPHAVAFSFYATKTLTTGEGGMITTDSEEMADHIRIMTLHGISKDAWKRYTAEGSWYYEIIAPGFKYNMTDIAAAMGLAQLKKVQRMQQRRTEIARRYTDAFHSTPALKTPITHYRSNLKWVIKAECFSSDAQTRVDGEQFQFQHAWHLYMLRLNLDRLRIDRAHFIGELKKRNIGASVHFIPLHLHPYYRKTYGLKPEDFPVAYQEYLREVSLPIYSRMTDQDVNDVVSAVLDITGQFSN